MPKRSFMDYVQSAAKFGVAVFGVAAMAGVHAYSNNPNVGTADLIVAVVTAVVIWAVPNKPLTPKL